MFNKADHIREKYLELNMYPSIFCTGCGIGNVLNYSLRALDAEKIDLDKTVFVSGIGCSSRLPGYIDADGLLDCERLRESERDRARGPPSLQSGSRR